MSEKNPIYSPQNGDIIRIFENSVGINRDDTLFSADKSIDAEWFRFHNGKPRLIGGIEKILSGSSHIIRNIYMVSIEDYIRVFLFRDTGISQADLFSNGSISAEIDRTPAGWITPVLGEPSLIFSYDIFNQTNTIDGALEVNKYLFFSGMPNSQNPNQTQEAEIYYGNINSADPFLPVGQTTAGGIIVVNQYLMKYGNNGIIFYSEQDNPFNFPIDNHAVISNEKIIMAAINGDGFLAWDSSEDLIQVHVNPSPDIIITKDVVASGASMISPSSLVAAPRNTFFWCGNNQFYMYNGSMNFVPNQENIASIFSSLNKTYIGKIWGIYMPAFKEVWFFTPQNQSTECNHAYFFSIEDFKWSDSSFSRSTGFVYNPYLYPLLADSQQNIYSGDGRYSVWAHEKGWSIKNNNIEYPIHAWIQTKYYTLITQNASLNLRMNIKKLEKDITHSDTISLDIFTYDYPNSDPITYGSFPLTTSNVQSNFQVEGSFISFKFSSQVKNGVIQFGNCIFQYIPGSIRS